METRKEEIKPRVARNISSSSSRKNFTDRDLDNTITEPTKVQSPNKSFSDTFTTEKNDRNNESVLSRVKHALLDSCTNNYLRREILRLFLVKLNWK